MRLILLVPSLLAAQSIFPNLNFDEGEPGKAPPGWLVPIPAGTIAEVRNGTECRNGACVFLTRTEQPPPNTFGSVMQSKSAKTFAGKKFVFRAAIRVENSSVAEDRVQLWARVDLPNQQRGFFENMDDRPIRTGDWAIYEVRGEVEPDATLINFGIMAFGKARAWVDDAELEIVDAHPETAEVRAVRTAIDEQYRLITDPVAKTEILSVKMLGGDAIVRTRVTADIGETQLVSNFVDQWSESVDKHWARMASTPRAKREVIPPLTPERIKQITGELAARSTELSGVTAGAPHTDLAAFGKAVGNAKIVALGEATHGTREIFQMKHRLLEYLVKEKGFTVFAIEANWPESMAADRYIKTGEGDPRKALKDMYFWTWQTEEVLAMLEWMREFNKAPGDHPILSFTAFDMQVHDVAAAKVVAFVEQHLEADAPAVKEAYEIFKSLPPTAMNDARFTGAATMAGKIVTLLDSRPAATAEIRQMARTVEQALRKRSPGAGAGYRDEMMAKNFQWVMDVEHPGEKVVVWAHNGHVSKTRSNGYYRPMGNWLNEKYGKDMYVAGFAIHTGSVRAYGNAGGRSTGLATHEIPAAPNDSGTAVLRAAGKPLFFLDIAAEREGALARWLRSRNGFRECGSIWFLAGAPNNNLAVLSPAESFDGLIYMEKTQAAKGL